MHTHTHTSTCAHAHTHTHTHIHTQDRTIAVWDMRNSKDIVLRRVLVGHRAAVNVVDFDDRYIVSASGDRTIKVGRSESPWGVVRVVCGCCEGVRVVCG